LGSPPKKIIYLKNLVKVFEKTVEGNINTQLAYEIKHMDKKRYNMILKQEEEARKLNMIKFYQKRKK
jgi:hypothetical protein